MLEFEKLWNNFPEKSVLQARCRNEQPDGSSKPFTDYCAIMLSEALIRQGVSTTSAKVKKCWSHQGKGMPHILLAEDLAQWLSKSSIGGLGSEEKIKPETFQDDLKGRTGIVFFKDYWRREGQTFENRTGDHIDLWNKDKITSSSMFTRGLLEFFGRVSDLNDSKEIWFWEVR